MKLNNNKKQFKIDRRKKRNSKQLTLSNRIQKMFGLQWVKRNKSRVSLNSIDTILKNKMTNIINKKK